MSFTDLDAICPKQRSGEGHGFLLQRNSRALYQCDDIAFSFLFFSSVGWGD